MSEEIPRAPTCGSNPMSNILSASSNTTYVALRRLVTRPKHTKRGEHEDDTCLHFEELIEQMKQ